MPWFFYVWLFSVLPLLILSSRWKPATVALLGVDGFICILWMLYFTWKGATVRRFRVVSC